MADEGTVSYDDIRAAAHPSVAHVLQFFSFRHLPPELAELSKPFCDLAYKLAATLPANPETTTGLRKLLEAKDCIVRSALAD